MFDLFKKWFHQNPNNVVNYPPLTLRGSAVQMVRAEAPLFRGPKSISEEVISRVAKEIKLEGLEALGSTPSENPNEKGLGHL